MKTYKKLFYDLKSFFLLWSTQSLSTLGSAMTNFALVVWSYQAKGSALTTALLSVCSYAPYVVMSIFAGAAVTDGIKKQLCLQAIPSPHFVRSWFSSCFNPTG